MIVSSALSFIEEPLTWVLERLHADVGLSWGWSIVALTIVVRMLMVPLTVKQIHSMQNLQRHAPQMKEIQRKYKDDRSRRNEELMRFYKENEINPASSCLPILVQIPVFIALFYVLRGFKDEIFPEYQRLGETAADLRWLDVVPDITAAANSHWSGYLLLAIYAISQTTATLLMSTTMERTQRIIMLALPLIFLFFVLNFPAGLVLYWVTTNLWTTGQGLITRRLMPKPALPEKRTSRAPARADGTGEDGQRAKAPERAAAAPRKVKRKKKTRR